MVLERPTGQAEAAAFDPALPPVELLDVLDVLAVDDDDDVSLDELDEPEDDALLLLLSDAVELDRLSVR
ncbi:MAG: hypothetical protein ACTHMS_07990 [Jatrophihabitans sp.]|uniref:hypothetical protein n=1 Tax=Jatrophihabitans sp. TaxID=1932789 RepID=UPI003F7FD3AB